MLKIISVFLLIAITIALEMLYHKIFRVTYFGFAPLFKELCVCVIISLVIMGTLMKPFLPKEKASHGNQNSNSVPSGLAVETDEEPLNIAGEYGNESIYLSLEEYDSNQYTCNLFWNYGKLLETGIICLNSECLLDGGTQITVVGISDGEISITLQGEDFLYENINLICWAN